MNWKYEYSRLQYLRIKTQEMVIVYYQLFFFSLHFLFNKSISLFINSEEQNVKWTKSHAKEVLILLLDYNKHQTNIKVFFFCLPFFQQR